MVGLTLLLSLAMGGAAGNPIVAGNDVISLPIPTPQQLAWQQNEIMVRAHTCCPVHKQSSGSVRCCGVWSDAQGCVSWRRQGWEGWRRQVWQFDARDLHGLMRGKHGHGLLRKSDVGRCGVRC